MSDALIASQQAEINRLNGELAKVRSEAKEHRIAKRKAVEELETLKKGGDGETAKLTKQVADLTGERDEWKAKAEANPGVLQTKIDELTGKIRTRDHTDAFKELAKDAGVLQEQTALDDLWKATEWKADSDAVDKAGLKAKITEALAARPWLKPPAEDPAEAAEAARKAADLPLQNGVDASRAGRDTASKRMTVRASQLSDAEWMRNNQATLTPGYAVVDG